MTHLAHKLQVVIEGGGNMGAHFHTVSEEWHCFIYANQQNVRLAFDMIVYLEAQLKIAYTALMHFLLPIHRPRTIFTMSF